MVSLAEDWVSCLSFDGMFVILVASPFSADVSVWLFLLLGMFGEGSGGSPGLSLLLVAVGAVAFRRLTSSRNGHVVFVDGNP